MAVGQRTLADLKRECEELGLKVVCPLAKNGKIKENKKYFIEALRGHYLKVKYPSGNIPKHLQLVLAIESPMLADRFHERKPDQQDEIWNSSDWGFQEKMDGCRMLKIFVRGEGMHYYSRGISVTDYLPVEYKNIYQPDLDVERLGQFFESFIADSEVVCTSPKISTVMGNRGVVTETQLQAVSALLSLNDEESTYIQKAEGCPLKFFDFDCFFFNGEWLDEDHKAIEQEAREKISQVVSLTSKGCGLNCEHLETFYDKAVKKEYYDNLLLNGKEGVIAKHKKALYRAVEARSRNLWVKIKRSVKGSMTDSKLNDTLDAFVSGFGLGEEGKGFENLVGWIGFSVNLIKPNGERVPHEIARVSGIDLETRKKITCLGSDGKPKMVQEVYGAVAEIDGQDISARAWRLSHAKIIRWRNDKIPEQCEMQEEFLKSLIL